MVSTSVDGVIAVLLRRCPCAIATMNDRQIKHSESWTVSSIPVDRQHVPLTSHIKHLQDIVEYLVR
jgi:hypothetical protein